MSAETATATGTAAGLSTGLSHALAGGGPVAEPWLRGLLERGVARIGAPDVVLGVSLAGRHTVASGGTGSPGGTGGEGGPGGAAVPPGWRERLRFETGSLSKTFTGLLLAEADAAGLLALDQPVGEALPGLRLPFPETRRITLRHLATHTSGLPRVPWALLPGAVLRPYRNGYRGYDTTRLLAEFAATRPRHEPGTRWGYSNFGLALLGPVLARAAGRRYPELLAERVLRPLGLDATTAAPHGGWGAPGAGVSAEAVGRRSRGRPLPPSEMGAFAAAGAVRSTVADLLRYADALVAPQAAPGAGASLRAALDEVRRPLLRRGPGLHETHTLTWYQHPAPGGPLLFHAGATFGQLAFVGFQPASGAAVVGLADRHDRTCALIHICYALLYELCRRADAGR